MIKLVAIDIGGTLINDNNVIPEKNLEILKFVKQYNIKIALVTARMYSSTKYISNSISADYGVFGNGSNIIDLNNNEIIFTETLNDEYAKKIIEYAKRNNLYVHLNEIFEETSDEMKYFTLKHILLNKKYPENLKSNIKLESNILEYIKNINNIVKIVLVSENNLDFVLDDIKKISDSLFITEYSKNLYESTINKTINYIEIGNKPSTKAIGLKKLISSLNILKDEVLVIGDGDNDIEMFKEFKNSGCLFNGSEEPKKYANYISKFTNNEAGVSDIINYYMKGLVKRI